MNFNPLYLCFAFLLIICLLSYWIGGAHDRIIKKMLDADKEEREQGRW